MLSNATRLAAILCAFLCLITAARPRSAVITSQAQAGELRGRIRVVGLLSVKRAINEGLKIMAAWFGLGWGMRVPVLPHRKTLCALSHVNY